ncbi:MULTISPECIES: inositol monophosphatase family protein [Alphaproteobacteria]|uniref:Inositol monophosphatase n=2 Tax=Alphaproteobacteria TaxID=28211 RepID=A0A512HCK5_9HYPH|nr:MULTISPECIES: inositol monophosphatase [Alphaproteobacteria]GEO83183.1 inositol monophosphatase [Ciceribacter naphthalenivorans]GLR20422.1 inositol monophosphatase [Ciceribacter naphthalenivorans]GLT03278.1 inositol monophosphatase [Sphingomonas psychrolutea]
MFNDHDIEAALHIVKEVAATEIMPRFRRLGTSDIAEKKSSIDLVTDADIKAERAITDALLRRWPGALIVGEEACETNPEAIGGLKDAELAFVIDPVDGTFNFAAGLPIFGTNLAVTSRGETVAGLIHEPMIGDTLVAVKGAGAKMVRADRDVEAIEVASVVSLSEMVGTISVNNLPFQERSRISGNLAATRMAFAYNCSAYEYWMVATGKVHFIGHHALMPWDHLAGVLIHQEAGGVTARFDGSPYLPGNTTGGILSAPDRESWQMILDHVIAPSRAL